MFVYYYVQIPEPFIEVEPLIVKLIPGLERSAEQAYRDGEHLQARIRSHAGLIAKTIEISVRSPIRGDSETWIPLEWEATGTPSLFPRMQADLVVAAVGPDLTQVALRGNYRVPLGGIGKSLDRVMLHRVAEASVKSFLDRIVTSLDRVTE